MVSGAMPQCPVFDEFPVHILGLDADLAGAGPTHGGFQVIDECGFTHVF